MKVLPAIVSVPVRCLPLFADTLKVTLPLPVPLAADVTTIQASSLLAVHEHPAVAVTVTTGPFPAAADSVAFAGLIAYEQLTAWFTVKV